MSTKSKVIGIVVVVILAVLGYIAFGGKSTLVTGTTNLDTLELSAGLIVDAGGITSTGATSLTGALKASGQITRGGYTSISTTSTSYTLSQSELTDHSLVDFVGSSTAATTISLPASSTLTTLIPSSGDTVSFVIRNATTTGSTLTLQGGTGTTFQKATSSASIATSGSAIITLYRLANTNVNALLLGNAN